MDKIPITVIGGGVVGLSIVHELLNRGYKDVVLLDKNERYGMEQSHRNSGVIHCGIYYNPGSLMAKLCVEGASLLYEFAEKHNVPVQNTGKLIVATNEEEEKTLDEYYNRGIVNGVPDIRKITEQELKKKEPNINGISAIYCPTTGIISSADFVRTLEKVVCSIHNESQYLMKRSQVKNIEPRDGYFSVSVMDPKGAVPDWSFDTEILINSAGLFSVDVAKMINSATPYEEIYLRGEYHKINRKRRPELNVESVVCPTPQLVTLPDGTIFPDWGIRIIPTFGMDSQGNAISGREAWIGPKFLSTESPSDTRFGLVDKKVYYELARKLLPGLTMDDLQVSDSGVLGFLRKTWDFKIYKEEKHPNCIQLLGMESPALTSSLSIGKYVANLLP